MNMNASHHYFVGLDVHLRFTAVCILDPNGKIVKEESVKGHSEEVCQFLCETLVGTFDVVLEACDGYGIWHERLKKIARRVVVAHPNHLRAIWNTKRKTDRIDSRKLSRLLMLDLIPSVHGPTSDVRDWRMLIQHRRKLVQNRTGIKCKLRAIFRRNHIKAPKNLWGKKSRVWLYETELPSVGESLQRDMLLANMEHYNQQIQLVEKELNRRADLHLGVKLLKTIPWIGNRTAEAVVAWIDDVSRFSNAKKIGAYFGLVVSEDFSGGKQRQRRITREGPGIVRQLLVEAVWRMHRYDPTIRGWVARLMHDQPKRKNIAVVAAAHKLARGMFAMLQTGEMWNPAA